MQAERLIKSGLVGTLFGSLLLGLWATAQKAQAQPTGLDQCPGIYYEEPYNSRTVVPVGCPANAYTQQQGQPSGVSSEVEPLPGTPNEPVAPLPGTPDEPVAPLPGDADTPASAPPLPEERSEPVAVVMPMDGQVSVLLKNNTNALITYEAVGHTQRRYLEGGAETMLQGLPLPLTLTMVRQDDGFIEVVPVASESGMLEISLDEEQEPLDENQGVVRIQEDGKVFVN